jgi:hypothetical protein
MKTVPYNPAGGPITAEIRSGFAQPGSYTLLLWKADANQILMEKNGNFINPDDDAYELPGDDNNRCIVECVATVVVTPPVTDYRVDLVISQDGQVLGGDTAAGSNASGVVPVDLFVQLIAGGAA